MERKEDLTLPIKLELETGGMTFLLFGALIFFTLEEYIIFLKQQGKLIL